MKRALVALLLLASSTSCGGKRDPLEAQAPMERKASASIPWATARGAKGLASMEAPATLVPPADAQAVLSAPVLTRVLRVHAQVGDEVEKGDVLAEVVMPQVLEAAGRLAAARIRIEAQSQLRDRLRKLQEHGLTRADDLAEAEAALGEARAERMAARSILGGAGIEEEEAARMLASNGAARLRSPIAGVVVSVDAPVGSVRDGAGPPLFRIVGKSGGRVVARLAGPLPEGAAAELVVHGKDPIPLRLVSQSPWVDPRDGNRELYFDGAIDLPPGALGKVRILLPEASEVVAIPLKALFLQDGQSHVYRMEGEAVREAPVRVLSSTGSEALVEGLTPGDRVASDAGRHAVSVAEEAP